MTLIIDGFPIIKDRVPLQFTVFDLLRGNYLATVEKYLILMNFSKFWGHNPILRRKSGLCTLILRVS